MHTDARGYAYETFRENGRVCRRYVGRGEWVSSAIYLDQLDRQRRADEKRKAREVEKHEQKLLNGLRTFCELTKAVMRSELETNGYHQHKRGVWRRRRANHADGDTNGMTQTKPTKALPAQADDAANLDRKALITKAQNGDANAAAAIWRDIRGHADLRAEMVRDWGDMARHSRLTLISRMFPKDELVHIATRAKIADMTSELCGPNPTPLETLLVERVCTCWLTLAYFEMAYTQGEFSINQANFHLKRIDGAHRRYLDSIKALATVRKLQLPTVQVNIGEKQVNVANLSTD